jgi:Uma2 family endonuclease
MSAVPKPIELLSVAEYIEGERHSEVRHEYVDGHVYAMAGASDEHNRIAGNIFSELRERLRGRRCEPFINDMKVRIPPAFAEAFYYPDVLVVCDPTDNAKYYRERPTVIIEVLSPETERTDRREKAIAYRQLPTLETYVLVEQDRMALTVLRRAEVGWQAERLQGPAALFRVPSIGIEIPLERIYERTAAVH